MLSTQHLFGAIFVSFSFFLRWRSLLTLLCITATRILVGGAVAIPAASLCINRRLYKIATTKTLTNSRKDVSPLCILVLFQVIHTLLLETPCSDWRRTHRCRNSYSSDGLRYVSFDLFPLAWYWCTSAEYIVEGHRFDIYEDVGCYPAVYNVWLAYPLSVAWPIAIGLISAVYCSEYPRSVIMTLTHRICFSFIYSGLYQAPSTI